MLVKFFCQYHNKKDYGTDCFNFLKMWVLPGRRWVKRWYQSLHMLSTMCCADKYKKSYVFHQTNKVIENCWLVFHYHVSIRLFRLTVHINKLVLPFAPSELHTAYTALAPQLSGFVPALLYLESPSCCSLYLAQILLLPWSLLWKPTILLLQWT